MGETKDIREAVQAELDFDPLVNSANIGVSNIMGEVALGGTVPSYPQYLEATAAARRVAGVRRVHNYLKVLLPPGDERDDPALTTAANNALAADVTVPDGVEAMSRDGNVQLTGTVGFARQRTAAVAAVTGLAGVRKVKNSIQVRGDADPADVTVQVQGALDRNALVPEDSDVEVGTDASTVTLTGHVRTWAEHDAAVGAAWMGIGVQEVRDHLTVTG